MLLDKLDRENSGKIQCQIFLNSQFWADLALDQKRHCVKRSGQSHSFLFSLVSSSALQFKLLVVSSTHFINSAFRGETGSFRMMFTSVVNTIPSVVAHHSFYNNENI